MLYIGAFFNILPTFAKTYKQTDEKIRFRLDCVFRGTY